MKVIKTKEYELKKEKVAKKSRIKEHYIHKKKILQLKGNDQVTNENSSEEENSYAADQLTNIESSVLSSAGDISKKLLIYGGKKFQQIYYQNRSKNLTQIEAIPKDNDVLYRIPEVKTNKQYQILSKQSYYKNKIQKEKSKRYIQKISSSAKKATVKAKETIQTVRRSVSALSNIGWIGLGIMLMIVLSLFIGIFSALSSGEAAQSSSLPLSKEVIEYRETIEEYAIKYDIEDFVTLIQAVMMKESEGKGNDPMNASLLEYNEEYPKEIGGIDDPEYSIDTGVHFLADCLKLSEVYEVYDLKKLSLAVQGYHYGKEYISWALNLFEGYTLSNSKVYADQKRLELKLDSYGNPMYAEEVLKYYHIGGNDIVAIAKSQVGNIGGETYWRWYGFTSRVEWCACFVSWCANEAGLIEQDLVPKFSYCPDGVNWFKQNGQWLDRTAIPQAGNIVFFDWNSDGIADHVGIVEKVEDNNIYTIEGNSNNECREKAYKTNSISIVGFGAISLLSF